MGVCMSSVKRVSSKDVAKEAGVSQATVSYVLNNTKGIKVKQETREAVIRAAKKLNYHPNLIAKSMRLKKAMSIGIVSDKSILSFIFMNVLEGIKDALVDRNYSMTLCLNKSSDIEGAEHIKYFSSNRIDGIIFAYANLTQEHIQYLNDNNIPFVVIHSNIKEEMNHLVKTDMSQAIYEAVSHILEKRGEAIAYFGVNAGDKNSPRYQGYVKALSRCSIPINDEYILKISETDDELNDIFDRYFKKLTAFPSAIIFDRNTLAFNFIKYASRKGIRIPEDIAIVAIGTSNFSTYSNPSLSAVEAPLYDMGYTGCEMLFDIMNEKETEEVVVLEWKFVIRDSI
jgi:DNA-binding LacI/PurR family transcriptional regulator